MDEEDRYSAAVDECIAPVDDDDDNCSIAVDPFGDSKYSVAVEE